MKSLNSSEILNNSCGASSNSDSSSSSNWSRELPPLSSSVCLKSSSQIPTPCLPETLVPPRRAPTSERVSAETLWPPQHAPDSEWLSDGVTGFPAIPQKENTVGAPCSERPFTFSEATASSVFFPPKTDSSSLLSSDHIKKHITTFTGLHQTKVLAGGRSIDIASVHTQAIVGERCTAPTQTKATAGGRYTTSASIMQINGSAEERLTDTASMPEDGTAGKRSINVGPTQTQATAAERSIDSDSMQTGTPAAKRSVNTGSTHTQATTRERAIINIGSTCTSSPALPAVRCPTFVGLSRPVSAAEASTAATTPGAADVSAATTQLRYLKKKDEQHAISGAASSLSTSGLAPHTARPEPVFVVHSADIVLLAKSFGHSLPPDLSHKYSRRLDGSVSPLFTSSAYGALSSSLSIPPYCQLPSISSSPLSTTVFTSSYSSNNFITHVYSRVRWLLQQLLSLFTSLYTSAFYPDSSMSKPSNTYIDSTVLHICVWVSALFYAFVCWTLRIILFFPRLLRHINEKCLTTPDPAPGLQGALAGGLYSTEALLPSNTFPYFFKETSTTTTVSPSSSTYFYIIIDGACSDQARQVDGGGVLLLTQLLRSVAERNVLTGSLNISRNSPQCLTSCNAVLYGHAPVAVILRNIGKSSSLEAVFGDDVSTVRTSDTTGVSPAVVSPVADTDFANASDAQSPFIITQRHGWRKGFRLWLRLLWRGLQRTSRKKSNYRSRYPTAALILRPPGGMSLLLVGHSDGRLETLRPSSAPPASDSSSSGTTGGVCIDKSRCWRASSSGSRIYEAKGVWFADDKLTANNTPFSFQNVKSTGALFPFPPGEAIAAPNASVQPGLTLTGDSNIFPSWQLVGVTLLQRPILSLRASPCNTRVCALTSHDVYILEISEEEQQEKWHSQCYSSMRSCSSGREIAEETDIGNKKGEGSIMRNTWSFYRSFRMSSLFAFGKEALHCCCRPIACCWTNSHQLLLLSSDGKLSVFCKDPREAVGEWRCVTRLQLHAAAKKALRSALQNSEVRGGAAGTSSITRSAGNINRETESGMKCRNGYTSSNESQTRRLTHGRNTCTDIRRRLVRKTTGLYDIATGRWESVEEAPIQERQRRRATSIQLDAGERKPISSSPSSLFFSSSSSCSAAQSDTAVGEAETVAAEEGGWQGSFPIAVLEYSAALQLLYLSIRGYTMLMVISWKTLYASEFFRSSSFFPAASSAFCTTATAVPRPSNRGRRGGARGVLASLRSRLLRRHERVVALLQEIDFSLPVCAQMRHLQKEQEQQQMQRQRRQYVEQDRSQANVVSTNGAAVLSNRGATREAQTRVLNAGRGGPRVTTAKTQHLKNAEVMDGPAWPDVDIISAKQHYPLHGEHVSKFQPAEHQQPESTQLMKASAVGGIYSFALTPQTLTAPYIALLHAGCNNVFIYDADVYGAGDPLLSESIMNNQDVSVLLQEEKEQQQQRVGFPVLRFCVPPPSADCRPAALAFLSTPPRKAPGGVSFFSPTPAAAPAAPTAGVLLCVRWAYTRLARTEEGKLKQGMIPAFTIIYSLPSIAPANARSRTSPFGWPTTPIGHSRKILSASAPPMSPLLSLPPQRASAAFRPLGGTAAPCASSAAFSERVAAAEQETLDAWRTAARVGLTSNTAASKSGGGGTAGVPRVSASSLAGHTLYTQRNACSSIPDGTSNGAIPSASGRYLQDICGLRGNTYSHLPLGAFKDGFLNPVYPGFTGIRSGSQGWGTEGLANVQADNTFCAKAATVEEPLTRYIQVASDGSGAMEYNAPWGKHSAWLGAAPLIKDNSKYSASRGIAAHTQQGDAESSDALHMGGSGSRSAGATGEYDFLKGNEKFSGEQHASARGGPPVGHGGASWMQRWQLQQQKLMQRWQLLQHQQQHANQLYPFYQSDMEIPPAQRSSFSRWIPSYPRVTVQRPAPYSFFRPYSSTGLPYICSLRGSYWSDPVLQQQQQNISQQQPSFVGRPRAYDLEEFHGDRTWRPFRTLQSGGVFNPAASQVLAPDTVAAGANVNIFAGLKPQQQTFVDTGKFAGGQTLLNDDLSTIACKGASVNAQGVHHETPLTQPIINPLLLEPQQIDYFTRAPLQDYTNVCTADRTNQLFDTPLPAATSPAPLVAGNGSLYDLGNSGGAGDGGVAGQAYSDGWYSMQRKALTGSSLRLSNSSILAPFTNSAWTANYSSGPRTSVL